MAELHKSNFYFQELITNKMTNIIDKAVETITFQIRESIMSSLL